MFWKQPQKYFPNKGILIKLKSGKNSNYEQDLLWKIKAVSNVIVRCYILIYYFQTILKKTSVLKKRAHGTVILYAGTN